MGKDTQNVVGLSIRFVTSLRRYQTSSFAHLGSPTHRHHSTALTNETSCNHPVSVDWKSSNGSWHDVVTRSLPSFPFFFVCVYLFINAFSPETSTRKTNSTLVFDGVLVARPANEINSFEPRRFQRLEVGTRPPRRTRIEHRHWPFAFTQPGRILFCFRTLKLFPFFLLFETTLDHQKKNRVGQTRKWAEKSSNHRPLNVPRWDFRDDDNPQAPLHQKEPSDQKKKR